VGFIVLALVVAVERAGCLTMLYYYVHDSYVPKLIISHLSRQMETRVRIIGIRSGINSIGTSSSSRKSRMIDNVVLLFA